ncbi:MAG TPA: hypothetical protein VGQ24_11320 [Gemmatimonadales bacterium]|nr:hypothetical protein [Gemmatimonadales bacterium]
MSSQKRCTRSASPAASWPDPAQYGQRDRAAGPTDVDHLDPLQAKARQHHLEGLPMADSTGLTGAPPRQVANIVTAGRLLSAAPG